MKTETFKGESTSAWGQTLPKAVQYTGSFEAYENVGEIRSANDWPSDDEILAMRNGERKAKAITSARTAALEAAGYKKPEKDDPRVVFAEFVANLLRGKQKKYTAESARAFALRALGHDENGNAVDENGVLIASEPVSA